MREEIDKSFASDSVVIHNVGEETEKPLRSNWADLSSLFSSAAEALACRRILGYKHGTTMGTQLDLYDKHLPKVTNRYGRRWASFSSPRESLCIFVRFRACFLFVDIPA